MTPPCIVCDVLPIAKADPEAAICTLIMIVGSCATIVYLRRRMCKDHRDAWALSLVRGAAMLESTIVSHAERSKPA